MIPTILRDLSTTVDLQTRLLLPVPDNQWPTPNSTPTPPPLPATRRLPRSHRKLPLPSLHPGTSNRPSDLNEDGKSFYNPPAPKSKAYEEFPDPIDKTLSPGGFDAHIYFYQVCVLCVTTRVVTNGSRIMRNKQSSRRSCGSGFGENVRY